MFKTEMTKPENYSVQFDGIRNYNYYRYATMIATDCEQIHRAVSTVMKNRLYGRLTKRGK